MSSFRLKRSEMEKSFLITLHIWLVRYQPVENYGKQSIPRERLRYPNADLCPLVHNDDSNRHDC